MMEEAMVPFGLALLDYVNGDTSQQIVLERDDGVSEGLPVSVFFRKASEFFPLEKTALGLCRGRVLDIGAGAGIHSLAIQELGLAVTAVDISPHAVDVMSKMGVRDARCIDIFDFTSETFDTLLLLGHGIGLVENLEGLGRFFITLENLIKPGGQLLLNSLDVSCTDDPKHLAYHESNIKSGRYIGEIRLRIHYKHIIGSYYTWLHIDSDTLSNVALEADWNAEVITRENDGNYLAKMTRRG
jgi:2-polyprenyl-3-methyl-5-hydroxy-6-metoxy-1,4-benzoquinol methylase